LIIREGQYIDVVAQNLKRWCKYGWLLMNQIFKFEGNIVKKHENYLSKGEKEIDKQINSLPKNSEYKQSARSGTGEKDE